MLRSYHSITVCVICITHYLVYVLIIVNFSRLPKHAAYIENALVSFVSGEINQYQFYASNMHNMYNMNII